MEYTAIAQWLNTAFAGYDGAILGFMNKLAEGAGGFLTPLMKAITFLGEKGILMLIIALGLMCFSKTRRAGVCVFGAVCCGALITNIILKDWVARPRPFEYLAQYRAYWEAVGSPAEDGFSFPSGHVTAATAGMAALCFTRGKKLILPSVLVVLLMCVSRNYLMAHFPSDVLFAVLIGLFAAYVAYLITKAIFDYLEDNDDFPFCAALLQFDLPVKIPKMSLAGIGAKRASRGSHRSLGDAEDADGDVDTAEGAGHSETRPARASGGSHARSASADNTGAWRTALSGVKGATGKLVARIGKSSEAEEERKEAKSVKSDWNSRWESYRSARDAKQNAAAPETDEVRIAAAKAPSAADTAPSDATVRIDSVSAVQREISGAKLSAKESVISDAADIPEEEIAADNSSVDDIDWERLGLNFLADDEALSGTEVDLDEPKRTRRDIQRAARGGAYRGRHEK